MTRSLPFHILNLLIIFGSALSVKAVNPDLSKIDYLIKRTRGFLFKSGATKQDIDSASFYSDQAFKLAGISGDKNSIGNTLLLRALLSNRNNRANEGLALAEEALFIFKDNKNIHGQAEAYIVIGQHYGNTAKDLPMKINYYRKALEIFTNLNDVNRQATVYKELAGYQELANDITGALTSLRAALHAAAVSHRQDVQGIYDLMGNCLSAKGDYLDGLKYGLLAVKAAETVQDSSLQLCTIFNHVGLTYFSLRDYARSYAFYVKSYAIAQHFKDVDSEITLLINMATALIHLNQPLKALPVLNRLKLLVKSLPSDPELNYYINYAYSRVYLAEKDLPKAESVLTSTEKYAAQTNNQILKARVLALRIEYLLDSKHYALCYPLLSEMLSLCKQTSSPTDLGNNELLWFKTDSALNKYPSAVNHYQRYKSVMDSIFTMRRNLQTDMLNIEFETERRDKDIQLKSSRIEILDKQALLQESRVERAGLMKNVMLGGSSCLLIILGLGYNRYRLKIRSNLQLEEKQKEIIAKNRSLEKLLQENEWLLREVHHRVKNNLQIIISLLHSQTAYMKDEKALRAVMESQHRVQAMSLIHQKLYKTTNTSAVYMPEYIRDLVFYLKDSFKISSQVLIKDDIESITLDVSQAVPIGLIINEIVTNAFKYAFPYSENDLLVVRFVHVSNLEVELEISDNGKGLPADFSEQPNASFGMVLIRGLADELEGCLDIKSGYGTTVTTRFKLNRMRAA